MTRKAAALLVSLVGCTTTPLPGDSDLDAGYDAADTAADTTIGDTTIGDTIGDTASSDASPDAARPTYLRTLNSSDDFMALLGSQPGTKWLAKPANIPAQPPIGNGCLFQNPDLYAFHVPFLRSFPETATLTSQDYVARVLTRSTRVWWGGEIGFQANAIHPIAGAGGVYVYTFYTEDTAGNRLTEQDIREVHAIISACAPFATARLAFLPTSNEQIATTRALAPMLMNDGIAVSLQ